MRKILTILIGVAIPVTVFPRPVGAGIITASNDVVEMATAGSMFTSRRSILDEHARPLMGWMGESPILNEDVEQNKSVQFSRFINQYRVMSEPPRVDFRKIHIHVGSGDIIVSDAIVPAPLVRKKSETHTKWETMIVPDTATLLLLALGSLLFLCDRRWRLGLNN